MLICREDVSDAGDDFRSVAIQRIVSLLLARRAQLVSEHNRAHLYWNALKVGNRQVGFERSNAPGLVFADYKLKVVFARRQLKTAVVLNILSLDQFRGVHCQLHSVAHFTCWSFHCIGDNTQNINGCTVLVTISDESNWRSWHHQRSRHIKPAAIDAEI